VLAKVQSKEQEKVNKQTGDIRKKRRELLANRKGSGDLTR
jgi:hypothetical protein